MPGPEDGWNERYVSGDLPWDTGSPDTYLVEMVSRWPMCRGRVLDVGCGTGTNSIWLARQGFEVIGLDISGEAIGIARRRAEGQGVSCRFVREDFLHFDAGGGEYIFLFDRGCFHSIPTEKGRRSFASRAAQLLSPHGLWLSMIGNSDDPMPDQGPPKLSALEIATFMEPLFEILHLSSCMIESRGGDEPPRFWQCLLKKR